MFTRIALVIGIGDYKDEPLKYCPPSAHDVFRLFVSDQYGQCDPNRSELITDIEEPITRESLDKIVKKCLSKINSEETFIFYYCGHADTINDELFLLTNDSDETIDGYRVSNC